MAINLRNILEQMMGPGAAGPAGSRPGETPSGAGPMGSMFGGPLGDMLGRIRPPATGGQAAAAGGLLGAVLGGGLARTGGMALLGLLAHRAYSQWQTQQAGAAPAPAEADFARPDAADSAG